MAGLRVLQAVLDINTRSWDIPRLEAVQGDYGSFTLQVTVVASGVVVNITGWRANFVASPDDIHIISDPVINFTDAANGKFEYTFVKEAFSTPGTIDNARFVLIKQDGTQLSGMPRFTYHVDEDPAQGKIDQKDYIGDFAAFQAQVTALQTQFNTLQSQITAMNVLPLDGTKKMTGTIVSEHDTPIAGQQTGAWWYRITKTLTNSFIQFSLATRVTGISNTKGLGYDFIQDYLRLNGKDVAIKDDSVQKTGNSTVSGVIDATNLKISTKDVATQDFVNTFAPYVQLFKGAAYFLDTNTYTFPVDAVKLGLYIDVSRYTPGTGPLEYGFRTIFIPREALLENSGKAIWEGMVGTDGAKKIFYGTATSIKGHADNGASPNSGWCIRRIGYR
ncbi:BppU family phage baseplate upper protein [Listeria booriae]|uniref:BppU family phage baseplate upper protein n=1 Tax=Listeria booriae TaxID=1552123 RepID=A0A842DNF8_9LIST|nr:BppU family phage baseplate upper protein [Listeria booriae]MBC2005537.1 BppU family phage baseplate upper protein [Listeria booriae]MBC2048198.1 BppU family phage baseplate upper protein [Listeria booriae]